MLTHHRTGLLIEEEEPDEVEQIHKWHEKMRDLVIGDVGGGRLGFSALRRNSFLRTSICTSLEGNFWQTSGKKPF